MSCLPVRIHRRPYIAFPQWEEPLLFIAANGSLLHHFQIVIVWCTVLACCIASAFYYHRVAINFDGAAGSKLFFLVMFRVYFSSILSH